MKYLVKIGVGSVPSAKYEAILEESKKELKNLFDPTDKVAYVVLRDWHNIEVVAIPEDKNCNCGCSCK